MQLPISDKLAKSFIVILAIFSAIVFGTAVSFQTELTFYVTAALAALIFHLTLPRYTILPFLLLVFYTPSYTRIDIIAVLFFGSGTFYLIKNKRLFLLNNPALLRPLVALATIILISTLWGLFINKNVIEDIYRDGRNFIYWLFIIPLLAWSPKSNSTTWIANNMLLMALCVCLLAIVQGIFAVRLVETGLVADLDTMNMQAMSTVRVQIPGFMFAMFGILYTTALLLGRAWKPRFLLIIFSILAIGIIFNFGRALWFWTFIGMLVVAVQYQLKGLIRFLAWVTIPAIMGLAALAFFKPDLVEAITTRIFSVTDEGGRGSSYGWRKLENKYSVESLESSYLLGVSMGGKYRPFNELLANFPDHTIYVHNGYLYLLLKTSIFGLLAYLWLTKNVVQTLRQYKPKSNIEKAITTASLAYIVGFLGINFTEPEVMSHYGLPPWIAICAMAFFMAKSQPLPVNNSLRPKKADFLPTEPMQIRSV